MGILQKAAANAIGNPTITNHLCEALAAMNRKDEAKARLEGLPKGNAAFKESKDAQELRSRIGGLAFKER